MVATTLRFILLTTGFVINPLVYAFRPAAVPRHLVYRRFVARLRSSPTFNGCNDGISSKSLDESNAYSSDYSEVPLSNVPVLEVEGRAMFPGNRDVLLVYELAWLDFFQRLLSLGAYGEMPTSPLIISAATSKPKPKIPPCSVSQSTGPVAALTAKNGRGIFYSHFLRGERVGVVMRVLDYRELDNGATLLVCAQAVARVAIPDSQDIQRLPRVPGSKLLMSPGGTVSLALMHDDEEVAAAALTLASSDDASSFTQSNIDATSGDSKNGESDNHDDSTLYPSADVATGAWCAAWANFDIPPFVETPRWYLRGIDALAPMACAPSSSEDRDAQLAAAEATTRTAADVARAAYSKAPQHRGSASEVFTKDSKDRSAESTGIADEATESMLTSLAEVEAAVWAELETYVAIAGSLRSSGVFCLPSALLALRPALAPPALHPARRAWRLSYALAAILPDLPKGRGTKDIRFESQRSGDFESQRSGDDGSDSLDGHEEAIEGTVIAELSRQSLLEEKSTAKRLQRLLQELEGERRMMAAAKMMESISRDHRDNEGNSKSDSKPFPNA